MSERNALERIDGGLGAKPALIVVDVVAGFTDPTCPLGSEADAVVEANGIVPVLQWTFYSSSGVNKEYSVHCGIGPMPQWMPMASRQRCSARFILYSCQ